MNDNPRRLIRHAFFRWYVRVEVPCLHPGLHDDGNGILFVRVLFFCMLSQFCFFLIRVQNSMLLIDVVHEIFALEDAVSFNFALGAPHVKRRVKSCRPASTAPITGLLHAVTIIASEQLQPFCRKIK